jgi:hypothetical protein
MAITLPDNFDQQRPVRKKYVRHRPLLSRIVFVSG